MKEVRELEVSMQRTFARHEQLDDVDNTGRTSPVPMDRSGKTFWRSSGGPWPRPSKSWRVRNSKGAWHRRYSSRQRLPLPVYESLKRALDITLVTLSLPMVLPLVGLLVLLVKIDNPGPAFYRQQRTGKGGQRFALFKMRTMVANADQLKQKLAHLNTQSYPDFKIVNDPRITRIGRILRRTSLDELPQLFNVLKGEMSLVGPRPTSFRADSYQLWQTARLAVTPGLTGLWQISGRAEVDFDQRLRLDIFYIQNRCLMLDLEILVRTVFAVTKGRGAS